jgi:hypothetical protein
MDRYPVNELEENEPQRVVTRSFKLDETKVTFRFYWSTRSDATGEDQGGWMVDIKDADGENLVMGQGLVLSQDLFDGYRHIAGIPGGQLFIYDSSQQGIEPGLRDFIDGRVQLWYRPEAEVV